MAIRFALAAFLLLSAILNVASETQAQTRSCSAASSCAEAVELWCSGYTRADRDKDGIPCESLCGGKAQVDEILAGRSCGTASGS